MNIVFILVEIEIYHAYNRYHSIYVIRLFYRKMPFGNVDFVATKNLHRINDIVLTTKFSKKTKPVYVSNVQATFNFRSVFSADN